jgi:cytoskeletal protein CcmA (bactofilin family)
MKKAIVIIAVVVVALIISNVVLFWGGWPKGLVGSGNFETERYAFANFTEVEISDAFKFEIEQSSSYSIDVTADDNVMEYVRVSQDGQTLKIGLGRDLHIGPVTLKIGLGILPNLESVTLRASVTMPQLRNVIISGASRGTITGFNSTDDLAIDVSGASKVTGDITAGDAAIDVSGLSMFTGDITAGDVAFHISGASTIQVDGSANDMVADVSGDRHFNLDDFTVNNADVNFSGASSGTINLDGRLDGDLSGASKLWYIGEPTMGIINTSGAAKVSKK